MINVIKFVEHVTFIRGEGKPTDVQEREVGWSVSRNIVIVASERGGPGNNNSERLAHPNT